MTATKDMPTIRNIDEEIFNIALSTWRFANAETTPQRVESIKHNLAAILDLLVEKGSKPAC